MDPQLVIYCPNCREPAEPKPGRPGHFRCRIYWCRIRFQIPEAMLSLALARREARADAEREVQARVQPETATANAILPDSAYYPDRCLAWQPAVRV